MPESLIACVSLSHDNARQLDRLGLIFGPKCADILTRDSNRRFKMPESLNPPVIYARRFEPISLVIFSICPRVCSHESHHRFNMPEKKCLAIGPKYPSEKNLGIGSKCPSIRTHEPHLRFKAPESYIAWVSSSAQNA